MKRILKTLALSLAGLLLLAVIGFVIWAETPLGPMPEAVDALQSGNGVLVETTPWLTFSPQGDAPQTGFIFYPGGRVDPRSYAPAMRQIAAAGYLTVIPPMPLNMAFTAPDRAAEVMAAHPEIQRWVIGGHSLGGAMAAQFAYQHPRDVAAVVLWASYPPDASPLTDLGLPVLSIYGSEDMGRADIEARKGLLPPDTQWVFIECANHAQMGWYGPQPGDGEACLSREAQQSQVVEATLEFLRTIEQLKR
jgi:pimeloyl-ACP methyl ester carboxylesterase